MKCYDVDAKGYDADAKGYSADVRATIRMLRATFTTATGPGLSMMLSGSGVRRRVTDANVRC